MPVRLVWTEKERSRTKALKMESLSVLLSARRMDEEPNVQIREIFGVVKGVDERMD